MSYFPLNQPDGTKSNAWNGSEPAEFSNTIDGSTPNKALMQDTVYGGYTPSDNSDPVQGNPPAQKQRAWSSMFSRTNSGFSITTPKISSPAWQHKLNEKHRGRTPSDKDTIRYFDRSRQTRRVFIDCLCMWLVTAVICGGLAGTIAGFSSIDIITQKQKYAYNALVTALSILLGLAFAAQFKQYCEMMRWRFLASSYRTINDFEEVLGCDSWRSTFRLIFKGWRKGNFYPAKSQILALIWLCIFILFNVLTALIGLTYSIDVSDNWVWLEAGNVSVLDLSYISQMPQADPANYAVQWQEMAANLYGQLGQTFQLKESDPSFDDGYDDKIIFTSHDANFTEFWYRFIDASPTSDKLMATSNRTVSSTATCEEWRITAGGNAGFSPEDPNDPYAVYFNDSMGNAHYQQIMDVSAGLTTWMTNITGIGHCGPRCAKVLALQSGNNITEEEAAADDVPYVPTPRLWACNNTISQVTGYNESGFDDPDLLMLPDAQALLIGGAIGFSGINTENDDLQYQIINGDPENFFNMPGNFTAHGVAMSLMRFSMNTVAAMDRRGAPRLNTTGPTEPKQAQTINVKWWGAGAILAGVPFVQFLMLLGVVWFSGKAIILEPGYLSAAHLLYPIMQKVGPDGILMTADEMAEKLGPDVKIAYGVRPDANDPGHHEVDFVRDLDCVEESEGFGYIRGKMPEGRYD